MKESSSEPPGLQSLMVCSSTGKQLSFPEGHHHHHHPVPHHRPPLPLHKTDREQEPSLATDIFRRFVGGSVAGVASSLCSHPFDTIKARMQRGLSPSIGACVRDMFASEGVRGFYRGVTPPIVVNGTYNAVLFSVNKYMTKLVTPADHPQGEPLPLWTVALAGQLAAPFTVLVMAPAELIKLRLQVQPKGRDRLYTGPVDCAKKLCKHHGFRIFYRGYMPGVATRLIGLPFYFTAYEVAKRAFLESTGEETLPTCYVPLCGSAAGVCYWSVAYPMDFTKTSVQTTHLAWREVVDTTLENVGYRGFYRGFSAGILRAVPAHASVWLSMEETIKFLQKIGL